MFKIVSSFLLVFYIAACDMNSKDIVDKWRFSNLKNIEGFVTEFKYTHGRFPTDHELNVGLLNVLQLDFHESNVKGKVTDFYAFHVDSDQFIIEELFLLNNSLPASRLKIESEHGNRIVEAR